MSKVRSTHWASRAMLVLLLTLIVPSISAAQQRRVPPKPQHSRNAAPFLRAPRPHAFGRIARAAVQESEPNDSFPIATAVSLGDTISGLLTPMGDVDVFGFDLTAGTGVVLDVDASQFGSPLDPVLWLFLGDTLVAFSDDADGLDSRIQFTAPTTGRYYALIADWAGRGGTEYFYSLNIVPYVPPPPGPGDPTTRFAQGLSAPAGIAAADNGELYVADYFDWRVARVSAAGAVSTLASDIYFPQGLVVDSDGNVLVTASDSGVYRVTPAGSKSRFLSGFYAVAITVDEGGDVWVGGASSSAIEIRRYNARGVFKGSIDVTDMGGMGAMAFAPTGELYATNAWDGVFRVSTGGATRVISTPLRAQGLAFDRDGYLYLALAPAGEVHLYDPSFQPVAQPFAHSHLGYPLLLAFGRNATGAMTSRLFAASTFNDLEPQYAGAILEMNPAGMRAPGFRIGTTRPQMSPDNVADAILGAPGAVTAEVAHFLDLQGNRNGRLDVGDFRAYLRSLSSSTITTGRVQP